MARQPAEELQVSDPLVSLNIDQGVAVIRLNDPATLNALTATMAEALMQALHEAEAGARAVMLCGAGRGFCAGANLTSVGAMPKLAEFDAGLLLETHFNPLMRQLRDLKIPLVTAVRGAAAGIGASLALIGDIIVAADTAYFLQAFRRIGLVPDGGSTFMLARAAGRVRAMEMMLLGEKIPAPKALEWGLITRVVPEAELEARALDIARELAAGPSLALAQIRRLAWMGAESTFAEMLDAERATQRDTGRTADFLEGVGAFLQKRPARFQGR